MLKRAAHAFLVKLVLYRPTVFCMPWEQTGGETRGGELQGTHMGAPTHSGDANLYHFRHVANLRDAAGSLGERGSCEAWRLHICTPLRASGSLCPRLAPGFGSAPFVVP